MPKDGDRRKRLYGRKKRLQLDDDKDDDGISYYRQFVSSTLADPSAKQSPNKNGNIPSRNMGRRSATQTYAPSTSSNDTTNTVVTQGSDNQGSNHAEASQSPNERSGTSSPDPNCAICLGKLENKSFTDSCFHQFCFDCLVEWSKVKAECPLCKQPFKSIVHNVRSYKDYDQYHIPRPEERVSVGELFGDTGISFRFRTTTTDHRYAHVVDRINREIESRLLQRPARSSPIPSYRRLQQPASSDFRRRVYEEHLQLNLHEPNTRRRVRETSPTFFRNNPAQTHRLVPWLNRELNALLPGGEQVAFVLDLIVDLIKRYAIDSEEFYQHVLPYTGRHTRQFVREFMMFAKSAYHMVAYDRLCRYEPSDERNHDSESDNDNNEGIHVRNDSSRDLGLYGSSTSYRLPPLVLRPQPIYGNFASSLRSVSRDMNPEQMFFNPTMNSDSIFLPGSTMFPFPDQLGASTSGASVTQIEPIVCDETASESSSTDIEIVEVEKPWHERSPIQLSSNDDCDSDIMITGTTYITDPVKKEKKKKKHRRDSHCSERRSGKRKRDNSLDRHETKRLVSPDLPEMSSGSQSQSRSRSVSPLRLTIINRPPDYQHKKFMYKTHDGCGNTRSSSHSVVGSSSTESDTESHVSITSHSRKSKSSRSSIAIVEYRKKRSKSAKHKKHKKSKKYDESLETDNYSDGKHHKKTHKKRSSKSDKGSSRSGHSSSGSHSKHRRKSKQKKHDKDHTRHSDKHSSKSCTMTLSMHENRYKKSGNIYTSDSLDSDIDVETVPQKITEPSVESNNVADSNVEFVELNPAQAAVIDQELDQINKTLANNDYISTLMSGGDNSLIPETFENNDPNRLVNPDDVLNLRSFKKHPFGHKKSSKSSVKGMKSSENGSCTFAKHRLASSKLSSSHTATAEDNIQISDISSCTDTDLDRQLPSFLTFSTRNSDLSNHSSRMSNPFYSHGMHDTSMSSTNLIPQFLMSESLNCESPTSTNVSYLNSRPLVSYENPEIIDVENLSSDYNSDKSTEKSDDQKCLDNYKPCSSNDLDINFKANRHSIQSYKTSDNSIKIVDIENKRNEQSCNRLQNTTSLSDSYYNSYKSYKPRSNSLKLNTKDLPSYKTSSSNYYAEPNNDTSDKDMNDNDEIVEVDVVSDDNHDSDDPEIMSGHGDIRHNRDIDVLDDNHDSDDPEIMSHDSDIFHDKAGNVDADIDVVGCSDKDSIVEDSRNDNVYSSDVEVEHSDNVDSNSKGDSDYSIDLTDIKAKMSATHQDKEQNDNDSTISTDDEEQNSESKVNVPSRVSARSGSTSSYDNNWENCNKSENEKCEASDNDELSTSDGVSDIDENSPADMSSEVDNIPVSELEEAKDSETLPMISYTSASTSSTVLASEATIVNALRHHQSTVWANQSRLEARQHSPSATCDSMYQDDHSGELEHYEEPVSQRSNPPFSPQSPASSPLTSPAYPSSPESWNHHNLQPED